MEDIIGAVPIIRAMPNIASSVAEGMTALIGNKKMKSDQINVANMIFQTIGNKIWLEHEDQMDHLQLFQDLGQLIFSILLNVFIKSQSMRVFQKI